MTIYFNNDNTGYELMSFNHSASREDDGSFKELYNVIFPADIEIMSFVSAYGTGITSMVIKNENNTTIKSLSNLNLSILSANEFLTDSTDQITLVLDT